MAQQPGSAPAGLAGMQFGQSPLALQQSPQAQLSMFNGMGATPGSAISLQGLQLGASASPGSAMSIGGGMQLGMMPQAQAPGAMSMGAAGGDPRLMNPPTAPMMPGNMGGMYG
jgi:hypothetical protein